MSGGGTPRQQMIGLMYLVLLAMLAMNASKDLLNAFVSLERGINAIVHNFGEKNEKYYGTIDKAVAKMPALADKQKMAQEIKKKADEIVAKFEEGKTFLVESTGGLDDSGIPFAKDNQDVGMTYYVVKKEAEPLQKIVNEYRELIISTLDKDGIPENDYLIEEYKKILSTDEIPDAHEPSIKMDWAHQLTDHLPMAAVLANLTLWQSYVRAAEADVVGSIAGNLDGDGIVVNKLEGMAVFSSGYVLKGDTVKASVFMSAYNTNVVPLIYVGIPDSSKFKDGKYMDISGGKEKPPIIGESLPLSAVGGKGQFKKHASEVGVKSLEGVIGIPSTKGIEYHYFKQDYMVAEPTATMAASAMNVLYVGVDNPMEISAPGVSLDDIEPAAPGVSFRPVPNKPGHYIARASSPSNKDGLKFTVKKKDGTVLASPVFRVKRLPDPSASILGKEDGLISKGELKAASFLKAEMKNFDFNATVTVKEFKLTVSIGGDLKELSQKNGATLTDQMKTLLGQVGSGNRVYFEDIKASMPDGTIRPLPSIILKVR